MACRKRGMNRYEVHAALRERRDTVPSPSTIYRVFKRNQLNRRTPAMREEKRRIIKDKIGELGHVDLHQLSRDMFLVPPPKTAYIVSLVDSCSRLAWAEVLTSKKALPVMFKTLKMINTLHVTYGVQFAEILSDNGAEFASRTAPEEHPFEAMLIELGIKHRYTRPYRPQTNGKVERFWRTLDDETSSKEPPSTTSTTSPTNSSSTSSTTTTSDPIRPSAARHQRTSPPTMHKPFDQRISEHAQLRAQRSNPAFFLLRDGLLRFARNDDWTSIRVLAACLARGLL